MEIRRWIKGHHAPLAAVGVALLAVTLQVTWLVLDSGPPESDEWHHLTKAEVMHQGWVRDGVGGVFAQLRFLRSAFPPLVHMGTVPAAVLAGGFTMDVAVFSLAPSLVLLVLCTFGIARRTVGDGGAITAAFMVAAYPLVVSLSRKFLLDLTLASLVAASLWALLRSDSLRRPVWAWLAGALFGAALLAKFTAGVYLLGAFLWFTLPAAWATLRRWPIRTLAVALPLGALLVWTGKAGLGWVQARSPADLQGGHPPIDWFVVGEPFGLSMLWHVLLPLSVGLAVGAYFVQNDGVKRLLAVSAAAVAAIWLAGSWYLPHIHEVVNRVGGFSSEGGAGEGDPSASTLAGWLYYPWTLGRSMPRSWFHLLVVGIGVGTFHPKLRRKLGPLLVTGALAFLIINLSNNKEPRYTVALAPLIAVIASGWAIVLPRLFRRLVWGTIVAVALFFLLSWVPVHLHWWDPRPAAVWHQDRVRSSGVTIFTEYDYPESVTVWDVLLTPDFYAVSPLPREMPWEDDELPFGYIGP